MARTKNRFWHQSTIQPKRQFKFVAEVGNGRVLYPYLLRKITRPELTMPDKQHKILGHEFHFPVGTQQWNIVNIEFMDIAKDYADDGDVQNAALFLQNAIYAAGYIYPKSLPDATVGLTKGKAVVAMSNLEVFQLDAENRVLETYTFHNPFITKVNFGGEFSYDAEDFVMPNIDIRYDWAEIQPGLRGVLDQSYGGLTSDADRQAGRARTLSGDRLPDV